MSSQNMSEERESTRAEKSNANTNSSGTSSHSKDSTPSDVIYTLGEEWKPLSSCKEDNHYGSIPVPTTDNGFMSLPDLTDMPWLTEKDFQRLMDEKEEAKRQIKVFAILTFAFVSVSTLLLTTNLDVLTTSKSYYSMWIIGYTVSCALFGVLLTKSVHYCRLYHRQYTSITNV